MMCLSGLHNGAACSDHPPLEGEGRRASSEARGTPGWGAAHVDQNHPTPPPSLTSFTLASTLPLQGRVAPNSWSQEFKR